MKFAETVVIADGLPYEAKLAFIAFCAERCQNEIARHPSWNVKWSDHPVLAELVDALWARASSEKMPSPAELQDMRETLKALNQPDSDPGNDAEKGAKAVIDTTRVLLKGVTCLLDPAAATGRYVAGAAEGPYLIAAMAYRDFRAARKAEAGVTDAALLKLKEGVAVESLLKTLAAIPDWPRPTD